MAHAESVDASSLSSCSCESRSESRGDRSLADRVDALEGQLRLYRRGALAAALLLAVAAIMGQGGKGPIDLLEVRQLHVVNRDDRVVVALGSDVGENGLIAMTERRGALTTKISGSKAGGAIDVYNAKDMSVFFVEPTEHGATVGLRNNEGKTCGAMTVVSRGGGVALMDREGKPKWLAPPQP